MTTNTTLINSSTTVLEYLQNINDITDGVAGNNSGILGVAWVLVVMVLIWQATYIYTRSVGSSFVATSILSLPFTATMLYLGLIGWYFIILNIVLFILGVILQQRPDYS